MKRWICLILIISLAILPGCGKQVEDTIKKESVAEDTSKKESEEENDTEVGYDKSFEVIQSVLNTYDSVVMRILNAMKDAKIKGAISAEFGKDDSGTFPVILNIESEDQHKYALCMENGFRIRAIKDLETGEYIYMVVE